MGETKQAQKLAQKKAKREAAAARPKLTVEQRRKRNKSISDKLMEQDFRDSFLAKKHRVDLGPEKAKKVVKVKRVAEKVDRTEANLAAFAEQQALMSDGLLARVKAAQAVNR